jgi:hypothetical protein
MGMYSDIPYNQRTEVLICIPADVIALRYKVSVETTYLLGELVTPTGTLSITSKVSPSANISGGLYGIASLPQIPVTAILAHLRK